MRYEIISESFPAVVCHLEAGEQMKTESGSMIWMDPCITMETSGGGSIGKAFSRMMSGEKVFQNIYTADQAGMITFGSSFPGRILALQITPGSSFILQKTAFLASEMGVDLSIHFNKKIGTGVFGGEGFIMQKLSGQGIAFAEVDGDLVKHTLAAGQRLVVDTGNVLGFSEGVSIDIERVHGAKNVLFGGEGLTHTVLTGPGEVWLQTMPRTTFIDYIASNLPAGSSS